MKDLFQATHYSFLPTLSFYT